MSKIIYMKETFNLSIFQFFNLKSLLRGGNLRVSD